MITLIEALGYRSLRYVSQPLRRFHALVGPNATGKTTFLDVLPFLSKLVADGPQAAIKQRAIDYVDLCSGRRGDGFQLAIESTIPDELIGPHHDRVRYEVQIGTVGDTGQAGILGEKLLLKGPVATANREPDFGDLFPRLIEPPGPLYNPARQRSAKLVLHKNAKGNDNFYTEAGANRGGGWLPVFRFGPFKSALGNLPDDGRRFPISTWLRDYLARDVQELVLNSLAIRQSSPPGQSKGFKLDGSNLPWVVRDLREENPVAFGRWIGHLQTALPDLVDVDTVERPDDRHRYLIVRYAGGLTVPSWVVSDGTLRLLALTLPAYIPDFRGAVLIEEPENGIHPRALETVIQSLSSVYGAQVLVATHSAVILGSVDLEDVLCFSKGEQGWTDIVSGPQHPALREWKGESNLGLLFAAGVLG